MWPFSRRGHRKGATTSDGAGEVFRALEWSSVAPMPVTAPKMDVTIERSFRDGLTAFHDTRVTAEPLGHAVLPDAPAGRVEARPLLPLVFAEPAAPVTPVEAAPAFRAPPVTP